jgi:hypothetical protein
MNAKTALNIFFLFWATIGLFYVAFYIPKACAADSPLMFSGGVGVSNSLQDEHSHAWGVWQDVDHGSWTARFGYLNEGHRKGDKRDGIFAQGVWLHRLTPALASEFSIGPYYTATTVSTGAFTYKDEYRFALLGGFALRLDLTPHWLTSVGWQHVMFTKDSKDADVFLIGLGWRP